MASPIYGTDLAGYMQILGGRARGMNEAERLRRMQKQQNFDNAYRLAGMQDRMAAREQSRQDAYAWKAYNAAVRQAQAQQGHEWDAYRAGVSQDRYQNPYGPQINTMQAYGIPREAQVAQLFPNIFRASRVGGPGRTSRGTPDIVENIQKRREIAEISEEAIAGDPTASAALGAGPSPEAPSGVWPYLDSAGRFLWNNPTNILAHIQRLGRKSANLYYGNPILSGVNDIAWNPFNTPSAQQLEYEQARKAREDRIRKTAALLMQMQGGGQ